MTVNCNGVKLDAYLAPTINEPLHNKPHMRTSNAQTRLCGSHCTPRSLIMAFIVAYTICWPSRKHTANRDCTDTQAGLGLRCSHLPNSGFSVQRLNYIYAEQTSLCISCPWSIWVVSVICPFGLGVILAWFSGVSRFGLILMGRLGLHYVLYTQQIIL